MKPIEKAYFEKCKGLIAQKCGIGDFAGWKQRDYEKLCELIHKETNVSLSLTTIKRLLNKDINQLPQKATLDALSQFAGFPGWFDFIKCNSEIAATINGKSENGDNPQEQVHKNLAVKKKKSAYVIAFLVLFFFSAGPLFFLKKCIRAALQNDSQSVINVDTISGKKFPGLALTPPMGWNSYNSFGVKIDEVLIKEIADKLVESGMKDAGYQYLIIDEGWQAVSRDKSGNITADAERFPAGIKALADYLHSKGLKFGIYSCTGNKSWWGKPGGRGHEFQDAKTFASWGVDYVKYDWSSSNATDAPETYKIMRDAIYAAQRPMVFSICEWGVHQPWKWGKNVGHLWRNTKDISDCYDCKETYATGWKNILDKQVGLEKYAGPGHWNDPDMLEVGNPGLSLKESKAHFSMWCMLAAPLIAGNDLRKMTEETRKILTNKEAIAINQDSLGRQATRYANEDGKEVWVKELSGGNLAICFLNTSKSWMSLKVNWHQYPFIVKEYAIRDVWGEKDMGTTKTTLPVEIRSNEVLFLKLTKM